MVRMRCIVLFIIAGVGLALAFSSFLSSLDSGDVRNSSTETRYDLRSFKTRSSIGHTTNNTFWIVQISDIHISKFKDLARSPDLERFCKEYLTIIKPEVVLVSGDLTDAKTASGIESAQYKDEWIMYENAIKNCRTQTKAQWLDIRGNHDSFDVFDFESRNNYYRLHSAHGNDIKQRSDFQNAFIYTHKLPFGEYSFVGFDACSRPGPNRPFNFFGYLDDKQLQHLRSLATVSKRSNQTVWFGHFPTSLIVHSPSVLRQVMGSGIAYLCGHLHTLSNIVPKMYSRHKTGQLELELGDWKDNRIFRVMAFDHDLMSFTDSRLGAWPVVIITNPKNSQFYSSSEPLEMIQSSTHIRILVFSPHKATQVEVKIDRKLVGYAQQADPNQPLYVLPWDPAYYAHGLHRMEVLVEDEAGRNATVSQYFSVDGTQQPFEFLPRLILMLNIYSVGKLVFGIFVFVYAFILTSLRQLTYIRLCLLRGRMSVVLFVNACIMKLWLAARTNVTYYTLIGSVLYLTFGPWFVGYLLSDRLGVVFVWGIVIQDSFLAGGITYFYGIFQFVTFNVPITLLLGHLLDTRRKHGHTMLLGHHMSIWIPAMIIQMFTIYLVLTEFPRAYGQTSLLLGPLRTGSTLMLPVAVWLAYRADLKQILAVNGPA